MMMKKLLPATVLTVAVGLSVRTHEVRADVTKRAPDGCRTAHVILGWSELADQEQQKKVDETVWERVGLVMYGVKRSFLRLVDKPTPGKMHEASFEQYRVKGRENGVAYVGHCGYGGTCNLIADVFHRLYKRVGTPMVYCGPLPNVLESPSKAVIPSPEEYPSEGWCTPVNDIASCEDDEICTSMDPKVVHQGKEYGQCVIKAGGKRRAPDVEDEDED